MSTFGSPQTSNRAPTNAESPRKGWAAFRNAYPNVLRAIALAIVLFGVADYWLWWRQHAYQAEITNLRAGMTESERAKSDLIVRSEESKLRMAVALAKNQARWDPRLHLSISVDSGRMYLIRDGIMLRDMRAEIEPESMPAPPDSAETVAAEQAEESADTDAVADTGANGLGTTTRQHTVKKRIRTPAFAASAPERSVVQPRGERSIQEVRADSVPVIILVGGTRILGSSDPSMVQPGDVRLAQSDFRAILGSVAPGMSVYFY